MTARMAMGSCLGSLAVFLAHTLRLGGRASHSPLMARVRRGLARHGARWRRGRREGLGGGGGGALLGGVSGDSRAHGGPAPCGSCRCVPGMGVCARLSRTGGQLAVFFQEFFLQVLMKMKKMRKKKKNDREKKIK